MWSILLLLHFFDSASTNTYLQKCVSLFVFIFFVCHVCGWVCEFWYLYNFVVFLVYYAEFLLFCVCRGESILKSVDVDDWRLWGHRVPSPISRIQDPGALVSISFLRPGRRTSLTFIWKRDGQDWLPPKRTWPASEELWVVLHVLAGALLAGNEKQKMLAIFAVRSALCGGLGKYLNTKLKPIKQFSNQKLLFRPNLRRTCAKF